MKSPQSSVIANIGKIVLVIVAVLVIVFLILGIIFRNIVRSFRGSANNESSATSDTAIVQTQDEVMIVDYPPLEVTMHNVDEITSYSDQYLGQNVQLNGYVVAIEQPWGFVLREDGENVGEILILTHPSVVKSDSIPSITEDDDEKPVLVSGTFKRLTNQNTVEFGIDQDDIRDITFEDRWVIVPTEIRKL